jgi:hypothetical protein
MAESFGIVQRSWREHGKEYRFGALVFHFHNAGSGRNVTVKIINCLFGEPELIVVSESVHDQIVSLLGFTPQE